MSEDVDHLARRLREGEDAARVEAYRRLFDSEIGRFVLASILAEAGVGRVRPIDLGAESRCYLDGRLSMALRICELAGFDDAAVSVTVLDASDEMKGRTYERDPDTAGFGGPDPDAGPDATAGWD